MVYEDFVIQVGSRREHGHTAQVLKSPAGEGRNSFNLELDLAQIHSILAPRRSGVRGAAAEAAMDPGRDLRALASDSMARLAAQQVGDHLFRSLFSGQVKSLYDQSLGTLITSTGCGLRIKLKFDAQDPELAQLISFPWEFLWRRETRDFLSLSRLSPVVRYLDVPRPAAPILLESVLRVLVVVSNPRGLQALDVKRERVSLEAACRSWKGVEVTVLEGADSASIRRHLLERPFHILHFIGHGGFDPERGEGALFLEGPEGQPEPVTGQVLATFLKDFKTLGLVFLNACDTARADISGVNPFSGLAGALVLGGLPAVVAMQFPISDQAAIAFSTAFYQHLAIGDPVDVSLVEGRQAVLAAAPETYEWGTPVLFLRVPDGVVFQPRTSSGEGHGGWRWPKALTAALLAAILVILCLPAVEKLADRLARRHVLEIGQDFGSSVSGLSGVITMAELQPNGRMRLHFLFRNTSAKSLGVGLDYRSTYLADDAGNEYKVLATDATSEGAVDSIPPGDKIERWLEFPAPLNLARKFHVALAESGPAKTRFPFFTVALPGYPAYLSRSIPTAKPAPDTLALAVRCSIATTVPGFEGDCRGIELRKDGRMRWSFEFFNGSNHDQPIGFDYSAIHWIDEHGNRYPVLDSDTGGRPGQVFEDRLPRAVRRGYWFDFPAPRNSARSFTVTLVSPAKTGLRFLPFSITLPFYAPEYSVRQQPSAPLPLPAKSGPVSMSEEAPSLILLSESRKTPADAPPRAAVQDRPAKPTAKAPEIQPAKPPIPETRSDRSMLGKEKEEGSVPYEPSDAWEAYIHDDEGRDRALLQPVEKNPDRDWLFLYYTDYRKPRIRLAVLPVENKSLTPEFTNDDRNGHAQVPLELIEDLFSDSLFNTNRFSLIEPKRIQLVIAGQNVGSPDRITSESAIKVGRLLGADYLIIAAVDEWISKKSVSPSEKAKAEVAISFRALNASSGEVVFLKTERATAENWDLRFGGPKVPIVYSLQSCLNKGAYDLAMSLKTHPWRGSVAATIGNKIYINAGSNRGLVTGTKLMVLSKGKAVIDPVTGLPLGNEMEVIGTLTVTTVTEDLSVAVISQGCKGLKRGDRVEIAAGEKL